MQIRFEIQGVPSTNHRARSFIGDDGKIGHRKAKGFAAWKRSVVLQAQVARPRGWDTTRRYAVEVIGYMPSNIYDADNLRGVLDACEGVLWDNDRQCKPVIYDYEVEKKRPRLLVHAVAYDPASTIAEIEIVMRPRQS